MPTTKVKKRNRTGTKIILTASEDLVSEDKVHRIVNEKIDELKEDIDIEHSKLEEKVDKQNANIITVRETQLTMKGTVDSMYGNGSGRKGMLERMEESHQEFRKGITEKFEKESGHQSKFRHEIRNGLETINGQIAKIVTVDGTTEKVNKSWISWVKWVAGIAVGLGMFLLEEWARKNVFHLTT